LAWPGASLSPSWQGKKAAEPQNNQLFEHFVAIQLSFDLSRLFWLIPAF